MAWWKFWGKKKAERSEAEHRFQTQLEEALLNQNNLKDMALRMKEDRIRRLENTGISTRPRPKLSSQPS